MMEGRRRVSFGSWDSQAPGYKTDKRGRRLAAIRLPRDRPRLPGYTLSVDQSWKLAADNALELEWLAAREEVWDMATRSMSVAEVGVRLQAILARFPSLISGPGCGPPLDDAGAGQGADLDWRSIPRGQVSPELLPLPLPGREARSPCTPWCAARHVALQFSTHRGVPWSHMGAVVMLAKSR